MSERSFEPLLVTIAVTTHNRSDLLQRALRGAFAQTYAKLEILVSDDASTDNTRELMEAVIDRDSATCGSRSRRVSRAISRTHSTTQPASRS